MINSQVITVFNEIADILEILGEDGFRINTYRKVARVLKDCPEDLAELAREDKLASLAGVGKTSVAKICEYIETGQIGAHQELLGKIPEHLLDLLKISGFGPKGVATVWKKLEVETLEDLQRVIEDKSFEALPGFGAKKAETLLKGIAFLQSAQGRVKLNHALALSEVIVGWLRQVCEFESIELAGSLRRCCETIGDIDLLVAADAAQGEGIIKTFTGIEGCQEVLAAGKTKGSIRYHNPAICADVVQVGFYNGVEDWRLLGKTAVAVVVVLGGSILTWAARHAQKK